MVYYVLAHESNTRNALAWSITKHSSIIMFEQEVNHPSKRVNEQQGESNKSERRVKHPSEG
jgi:hypothetical protein